MSSPPKGAAQSAAQGAAQRAAQGAVRGAPRPSGRPRWRLGLAVSGAVLLLTCLVAEFGFRTTADQQMAYQIRKVREYVLGGSVDHFEGRPHIIYARHRENSGANSLGFSDGEWELEHEDGVFRIMCLGGSTTESGNSFGFRGSYPNFLGRLLNEGPQASGRRFEVMNCGISGWTSAETMVAYFLLLQDYRPDLVVLHHSVNDAAARNSIDFRPDYSHYRRPWPTPHFGFLTRLLVEHSDLYVWLSDLRRNPPTLTDISTTLQPGRYAWNGDGLPAETAGSFRRNVKTILDHARAQGAEGMLVTMPLDPDLVTDGPSGVGVHLYGALEHNEIMRELCASEGYLLADAAAACAADPGPWAELFIDLVHLVPGGNLAKANVVADVLTREWIPRLPEPAPLRGAGE